MTNQEIFEMLAEIECELFHASADHPEHEELKAAKEAVRKALEDFAKKTGCHN